MSGSERLIPGWKRQKLIRPVNVMTATGEVKYTFPDNQREDIDRTREMLGHTPMGVSNTSPWERKFDEQGIIPETETNSVVLYQAPVPVSEAAD